MCGILGILAKESYSRDEISKILDIIQHRGPDGRGISNFYASEANLNLSLGHVRLSILDLSKAGSQPMEYKSRYSITYNGEIYNYKEIKSDLIKKGFKFYSETDTEVILAAYSSMGKECLKHFNGMFSFAIYDSVEETIFIARDRFGVKPLYYFQDENTFAFSSEIKGLIANEYIRKKVVPDIEECKLYLKKGPQVWRKKTLFTNIFRFQKGSYYFGKVKDLHQQQIVEKSFYSIPIKNNDSFSEEDLVAKYGELLKSAISLRLRADVKIGTALSGGLDSSTIAFFINEEISKRGKKEMQKTFSSVYENKQYAHYDESNFIDLVANQLNVESNKIEVKHQDLIESYEKLIWAFDTPPEGTCMSGWLTYRLVKEKGVTISIDGQGADEQLAGYTPYLINYMIHKDFLNFLREMKVLLNFPYQKSLLIKIFILFILKKFRLDGFFDYLTKNLLGSSFSSKSNLKGILLDSFNKNLMNLLFHSDKLSMAMSIETRLPFMDYRLVEFIFSLPEEMKINRGWTKYINRLLMNNKLTDEIVWRKNKLGWPIPEEEWFKGPLKDFYKSHANSDFVKKISNMNSLTKFARNTTKYKIRKLNLAIWHKVFFERNFTDHPEL